MKISFGRSLKQKIIALCPCFIKLKFTTGANSVVLIISAMIYFQSHISGIAAIMSESQ